MEKEPFIIDVTDGQPPNVAGKGGEYPFEFSRSSMWEKSDDEIIKILRDMDDKLDYIMRNLKKY